MQPSTNNLGATFEREIREQPAVWKRIADTDAATRLAAALTDAAVFVGSGSSFFAAQIGALAMRRRGYDAHALPATESAAERKAYRDRIVVAISQSGASSDVLAALRDLQPRTVVALTNTIDSPLAKAANVVIDVGAGKEEAIPATKSVTATVAILLHAASIRAGEHARDPDVLVRTSNTVEQWLNGNDVARVAQAAQAIAKRRDLLFLGTDYGTFVAREAALKFKESTYMHAEGFAAGEFRHGSAAMVDEGSAIVGMMDRDGAHVVAQPIEEAGNRGALRFTIGSEELTGVERLGPIVDDPYNVLSWLVTVHLLALYTARARGVDSDAPRGLRKALTNE